MIATFLLYARTLKYLRFRQILYRFWCLRPRLISPLSETLYLRTPQASLCRPLTKPISMIGPEKFSFLNCEDELPSFHDWSAVGDGLLWRYNLHYFNDLTAINSGERVIWHNAFINRWMATQPFGSSVSWDAYPLSLRAVNWIKFHHSGTKLSPEMQENLAQQIHWLSHQIEWHLCGNHLFANAKALIAAGCFFDGQKADRWLMQGINILEREIGEQILPDGGHFELSPMYHALMTEDILDLIAITDCYQMPSLLQRRGLLARTAGAMLNWLETMCHPDGQISFFNDAALGIAPSLEDLKSYANSLGLMQADSVDTVLKQLPDSGYYRADIGKFSLLADMADVGASYIPGHAHADSLSFELSVDGFRLIVNGGTSTYNPGQLRHQERGTSAHSTVCIGAQDSSEIWGNFRVARRAFISNIVVEQTPTQVCLSASHDGYRRLTGRPVHFRHWQCRSGEILVHDRITPARRDAICRFILHPQIGVQQKTDHVFILNMPNGKSLQMDLLGAQIATAIYASEFGCRQNTLALIAPLFGGKSSARISFKEQS